MPNRIVVLTVGEFPPLQVLIDNPERYVRVRARLVNYHELETAEPNPALPVISVVQMEKTLGVAPAENLKARGLRRVF